MKRNGTIIYLSEEEKAMLKKLARDAGMSASAYIRIFIRSAEREQPTIEIPIPRRKKDKREIEYV